MELRDGSNNERKSRKPREGAWAGLAKFSKSNFTDSHPVLPANGGTNAASAAYISRPAERRLVLSGSIRYSRAVLGLTGTTTSTGMPGSS